MPCLYVCTQFLSLLNWPENAVLLCERYAYTLYTELSALDLVLVIPWSFNAVLCSIGTSAAKLWSSRLRSVVVITFASHAKGPRFDPGRNQRHILSDEKSSVRA